MSDDPQTEQLQRNADGSVTVLLATSIEAYGDKIDRLTFRKPSGKEIRACGGSPIKMMMGVGAEINGVAVLKYAELLGGVPASAIDQIDAADYLAVELAIASFFMPKDVVPTSSTATTTSPGDGSATLSQSSPWDSPNLSSLNVKRSA